MAFTTRSRRNLNLAASTGTNKHVGPGAYTSHANLNVAHGFAPFGSLATREDQGFTQLNQFTPGPGNYLEERHLNALVTKIEGPNDPTLPRKAIPFRTGASRFETKSLGLALDPDDATPGPGSYIKLNSFARDASTNKGFRDGPKGQQGGGQKDRERMSSLRACSAPSIPVHRQCFGFEEDDAGRLIRQPAPAEWMDGRGKDTAGPGHYDPRLDACAKRYDTACCSWERMGQRQMDFVSRGAAELPGPGAYTEKRLVRPKKISSAFAAPGRAQDRRAGVGSQVATDPGLGPGSYVGYGSTIKVKRRPPELQFFDSAADRFERGMPHGVPGPGQYPQKNLFIKDGGVTVFKKGRRFGTTGTASVPGATTPGPGTYPVEKYAAAFGGAGENGEDERGASAGGKRRVAGRPVPGAPAFGGSERRFAGFQGDEYKRNVGPGSYPVHSAIEHRVVDTTNGTQGSAFASRSTRGGGIPKERVQGPSPAHYSLQSTLGAAKQLRIASEKEGFLSAEMRFNKGTGSTANAANPGPGAYRTPSSIRLKSPHPQAVSAAVPPTHQSFARPVTLIPAFDCHGNRFLASKHANFPGPGAYESGKDRYIKKTYNCLFGKVF